MVLFLASSFWQVIPVPWSFFSMQITQTKACARFNSILKCLWCIAAFSGIQIVFLAAPFIFSCKHILLEHYHKTGAQGQVLPPVRLQILLFPLPTTTKPPSQHWAGSWTKVCILNKYLLNCNSIELFSSSAYNGIQIHVHPNHFNNVFCCDFSISSNAWNRQRHFALIDTDEE